MIPICTIYDNYANFFQILYVSFGNELVHFKKKDPLEFPKSIKYTLPLSKEAIANFFLII